MPATSILSVAFTVLLASTQVNGLGCYSSGNTFSSLHGGDTDTYGEVVADINTFCTTVDGTTLVTGEPGITHCSEWAITTSDHEDCYDDCIDGCGSDGFNEAASLLCQAGCDPNCDPGPSGSRHIDWAINLDGPTKEITWDICNTALNTELGGCQSGSEQNHDGFWFRIDPNDGACP